MEGARSRHRVLIATTNFGGGTGSHLVELLRRWDPWRWSVHLLCQGELELDPPETVEVTSRTTFGRMDRFPLAQLRRLRHLSRTVRRSRPELLHTYFFWPLVYGRLLRMRGAVPRLVENREDEGLHLGSREYGLLRATAHVPDRIICVSEAVRRATVEREEVDPARIRVIPNGVRLPASNGGGDGREVRRELGFPPEASVVGMVANLNRAVKGVRYFVDSIPAIREAVPHARFLVIGEGSQRESLEARARELGVGEQVVFAGFRSDVHRLYPIMDVSVLTSLSEGLSITLLESMSHGLPVVATRVGGNPEVVRDGVTGRLVPAADPPAFAAAVVSLLQDPETRRRMGEEGRRAVSERFALGRTAEAYEAIYRDLVAEPRAG